MALPEMDIVSEASVAEATVVVAEATVAVVATTVAAATVAVAAATAAAATATAAALRQRLPAAHEAGDDATPHQTEDEDQPAPDLRGEAAERGG